jgi:hypothetical protein
MEFVYSIPCAPNVTFNSTSSSSPLWSIARQRGFVRTRLKKELEEIDVLVSKLLSK